MNRAGLSSGNQIWIHSCSKLCALTMCTGGGTCNEIQCLWYKISI